MGLSLGGMKKPGQPIHVKDMDFLQPERAETRPPEDILKWYSPEASLLMVMGRRFETTMMCRCSPGAGGGMERSGVEGSATIAGDDFAGSVVCVEGNDRSGRGGARKDERRGAVGLGVRLLL